MNMHLNITYTLSRYYQMNELFNSEMRGLQGTIKIVQCNSETLRNNFFVYNHYQKRLFLQFPSIRYKH